MTSEEIVARRRRSAGSAGDAGGAVRRQVSRLYRARIVRAMADVVTEQGLAAATVARVTARAGCSRRTFYDLYTDRYDCFLDVLRETVERAAASARPAYEAERRWPDKLRAGLHALLEFFDHEPGSATICLLLSTEGGHAALRYRATVLAELAEIVDRGRAIGRLEPTQVAAEAVVGGCCAVAQNRIVRADGEPLLDLLGPLMAVIVGPFMGSARAGQELRRGTALSHPRGDWRKSVDRPVMPPKRLTGRTMLTLSAIAAQPGMSNRAVAEVSGISDQGQASRLLRRMQQLGLIENDRVGAATGEPNSWGITQAGVALVRAFGLK